MENANSETAAFALLFEFDGDIRKIRHVLYNCSASRPKIEGKTNEIGNVCGMVPVGIPVDTKNRRRTGLKEAERK